MLELLEYMYWSNLFVLFTGFPPIQKWKFYADFYLFNQMFLSEGGHFYGDMHFYATFFACQGFKKMAIFMLLCTFMRYFSLTWTSAKKEEAALLRELLLYSVIFWKVAVRK